MSIRVNDVFYTYGKKTPNETKALKGVSLNIKNNSFVAFVGETGSGKSTLVQHLNALLTPDSGQIEIDEYVLGNKKRKNKKVHELRKHVGVVFQFPEYQLFEETVEKDVAFGPRNFKIDEATALKKAHEALKAVNISPKYYKRSPFELSGGEKRRVAIAGILALEPDILVLDEPTAGLDPQGGQDIMNLLQDLYSKGKTIILVTHDMDLVLKYCEEVFVLKDGNILTSGNPHDVFSNLDENSSIDIPMLYSLGQSIKNRGVDIDLKSIRSVDDMAEFIYQRKKANK